MDTRRNSVAGLRSANERRERNLAEALSQLLARLDTHGSIDPVREEGPIEDARQALSSQESDATDNVAELRAAAKQLLSDIDSMTQPDGYYGDFSHWQRHMTDETMSIDWPNLAISAARLARALDGAV